MLVIVRLFAVDKEPGGMGGGKKEEARNVHDVLIWNSKTRSDLQNRLCHWKRCI